MLIDLPYVHPLRNFGMFSPSSLSEGARMVRKCLGLPVGKVLKLSVIFLLEHIDNVFSSCFCFDEFFIVVLKI